MTTSVSKNVKHCHLKRKLQSQEVGTNTGHSPGGHEVVVVEHLDEGLDLGPLGDLLLAHGGGHLAGIAVDACDQSVAIRTVSCAIINVLQRHIHTGL